MVQIESVLPLPVGPLPAITALACPDCGGCLTVRAEGDAGYLSFRCRIGHAFGLESLLATKEDGVERCLWVALTVLEELRALGRDLLQLEDSYPTPCSRSELGERIAHLGADAETLRRVASANRALALGGDGEGGAP